MAGVEKCELLKNIKAAGKSDKNWRLKVSGGCGCRCVAEKRRQMWFREEGVGGGGGK